jgi:acyl-CoA synthetase (AMP-forming)/AMP-acid ligase II
VNSKNVVAENNYILGNCDVVFVFYHSELSNEISELLRGTAVKRSVCMDRQDNGAVFIDDWLSCVAVLDLDVERMPNDIATISSSGGTTGRPKGVISTHLGWETKIANLFASMPVRKPPVHLVVAPMSHAAGSIGLMLMAAGATQIILPKFDPQRVMEAIEREGVTHLFLPPTAIYMMLSHPAVRDYDYSSLEHFIYAAAPMSVERLKECLAIFGPVMTQMFGQVEAPMLCTYLSPQDHLVIGDPKLERRLASCGRPTLLTPVAIMDDAGNLLASGETGEIVVRGNLVMAGYYKNPEATADVSKHGWHHTGDVGYIDEDGYVYIVDRKKDMIITGGFNVYPSEVEQIIWSHPAIQDCAVIGVPDPKWGEAVKAVVELKPGQSITEEEVIALCKARLGSVKAPKSLDIWDSLPRSPAGKVLKKDIRKVFWQNESRAV